MTIALRRPWPVWVISIYYGLGTLAPIYWNVREIIHHDSNPGAAGEFGDELQASDHFIALAGAVLCIYAAASLFQLKRIAWVLFIVILLCSPLTEFYHWLTKPAFGAYFRQIGYLGLASGIIVNGATLIYVNRLKRRGALFG